MTATIDVKRNIFDLCTDSADCYLAVIEVCLIALIDAFLASHCFVVLLYGALLGFSVIVF